MEINKQMCTTFSFATATFVIKLFISTGIDYKISPSFPIELEIGDADFMFFGASDIDADLFGFFFFGAFYIVEEDSPHENEHFGTFFQFFFLATWPWSFLYAFLAFES